MPKTDAQLAAEKKAKLIELAGLRVPKAVKAVSLLGNLANYQPSTPQKEAILKAVRDAIKGVEGRFAGASSEPEFKLPS
jgi:hypothetical protein